jgi:hypothetical protein
MDFIGDLLCIEQPLFQNKKMILELKPTISALSTFRDSRIDHIL